MWMRERERELSGGREACERTNVCQRMYNEKKICMCCRIEETSPY